MNEFVEKMLIEADNFETMAHRGRSHDLNSFHYWSLALGIYKALMDAPGLDDIDRLKIVLRHSTAFDIIYKYGVYYKLVDKNKE